MRPTLANYVIIEQLHDGDHSVVYRAEERRNGQKVVLKMPQTQRTALSHHQITHEFQLLSALDLPSVITVYGLEYAGERPFLVLEDFGGQSLTQLQLAGNLLLTDFLQLALKISDALDQLQQHHIIHKDLNPGNILLNPHTGQVKLIDFALATLLPNQSQTFTNPHILEGTLAYLSPEQTGRMNRPLDYRSDFYSLGVTLYELATGQLPFTSTDPLEMVHQHIARQPASPKDLYPEIPTVLAHIILKLLAKNAEDRYQTAVGLQADLQNCLDQLETHGKISNFVLGQHDYSGQLHFSQKLVGRDYELAILLGAFTDACTNTAQWVRISGPSGVGKSSLVREVYGPITAQQGIFIEGKFDPLQRNIPYYGWQQALTQFVAYLLTEPQEETAVWRDKILAAVGENGQLLTDLIPNLRYLLGEQPNVSTLSGTEALNRFRYTFTHFLRAIATPKHPICLFLDDLQWADTASLALLSHILQAQLPFILIVAAYRDNEVDAGHPLSKSLKTLHGNGINDHHLSIRNLSLSQVTDIIVDTIGDGTETAEFAALVHQKTEGNAFFVKAFLQTLYEKQLLQFEPPRNWYWSLDAIRQLTATDNVVNLLTKKIKTLPTTTQSLLQLAACIGTQFDVVTLATIADITPIQAQTQLQPALLADMLIPSQQGKDVLASYRFAHDRIHGAIYESISPANQQQYHWHIGNLLWDATLAQERSERPFTILNQWFFALDLITEETDRIRLVELSLVAGETAKASTAYSAAYDYLHTVGQLWAVENPIRWQTNYNLTLTLASAIADAAFLSSHIPEALIIIEIILQQASTFLDTVPALETKIKIYTAQNDFIRAIEIGTQSLAQLGILFPKTFTQADVDAALAETAVLFRNKTTSELMNLPEVSDPQQLAIAQILTTLRIPLYYTQPRQNIYFITQQINLMLQHGYSTDAGIIFANYAQHLFATNKNINVAWQYIELALHLAEKFQAKINRAFTMLVVYSFLNHWLFPLRESLPALQEANRLALTSGNFVIALFAGSNHCFHAYAAGMKLAYVEQQITVFRQEQEQLNLVNISPVNRIYHQFILNLMGQSDDPCLLTGMVYHEDELFQSTQSSPNTVHLSIFATAKLTLSYLFGKPEQALQYATMAEPHLARSPGSMRTPLLHFYGALAQLALHANCSPEEQASLLHQVAQSQAKMKRWATDAPMNFVHKWHLVEAERCRVNEQIGQAREHYDLAIKLAEQHGYTHVAALAAELAGSFYLAREQDDLAEFYLRKSSRLYGDWGAAAKVQQLAEQHPRFFRSTAVTLDTNAHLLDLLSISKASQALSQEVRLNRLLELVMEIVMENAGAERGVLFLEQNGQWLLMAETAVNTPITLQQPIPLANCKDVLATAVVHTARQTQEPILLKNASQARPFQHDPYIIQQQPRSILCLPIQHQGQLSGILYLENNLVAGSFTDDRIELLNLLLRQAAISLQNAQLYTNLKAEISERKQVEAELRQNQERFRALFDNTNDAVFTISGTGHILTANQQAVEMTGYSLDELAKMAYHQLAAPQDALDAANKFAQLIQKGQPLPLYERVLRTKNGVDIPVEINIGLVYDQNGDPLYFQSVVRDITERKLTEAQLRKNEQRYRALFERSNDAVFIMNLDGIYIAVNQQATDMLGYSTDEIIGMSYKDIVVPLEIDEAQGKLTQLLGRENTPLYERQFRKKNGTIFPVEMNVALVYDDAGHPLHYQGIVRDITQRKETEVQMIASLREKEVMLKEIHHRVKNNLQVISSLLDLQSEHVGDKRVQGLFLETRTRVRSMAFVHEQLYQATDLARIDFVDYIEQLTRYLSQSYRQYAGRVTLQLELSPLLLSVETAVPLGLIINELVSNALKYAFPIPKTGFILIRLDPSDAENQLCLIVEDNGIGLPDHIDFRRSPSLGLTIVMTLIDQLRATIRHLRLDPGTRFEIIFSTMEKDRT